MIVNGLDVAVVAVTLVALLLGLVAGIVRISLGILSIVAGLLAGIAFAESAARLVGRWIGSPELCLIVGFLAVFTLVLLAFSLVAWILRRSLARLGLGVADRVLGATAGTLVVLAAAAVVCLGLSSAAPAAAMVQGSRAVRLLAPAARATARRLPGPWRAEGRRLLALAHERWSRKPQASGERGRSAESAPASAVAAGKPR